MANPAFLTFDRLLDRALTDPEAEAEIARRYKRDAAVMVVDFTSMVRRTDAEGIVYALALANAAKRVVEPAVRESGGEVIKQVADTFFVVFNAAPPALAAALGCLDALAQFNQDRTGHIGDGTRTDPIHPCVGLAFGDTLIIPGENLYGAEVNRAFVLGEDVAGAREVLCSPAFLRALGAPPAGIGAHRAPADREDEAGFPFHVLRDYRG